MEGKAIVFFFIVFGVVAAFYFYSLITVHQSCDGEVVKNWIDWPVCVH